jgi:hypothetical protein
VRAELRQHDAVASGDLRGGGHRRETATLSLAAVIRLLPWKSPPSSGRPGRGWLSHPSRPRPTARGALENGGSDVSVRSGPVPAHAEAAEPRAPAPVRTARLPQSVTSQSHGQAAGHDRPVDGVGSRVGRIAHARRIKGRVGGTPGVGTGPSPRPLGERSGNGAKVATPPPPPSVTHDERCGQATALTMREHPEKARPRWSRLRCSIVAWALRYGESPRPPANVATSRSTTTTAPANPFHVWSGPLWVVHGRWPHTWELDSTLVLAVRWRSYGTRY